jgi:hypothetical protein
MPERIYLANGTEKFNGDIIEFSLNLSKMDQAKKFMFEFKGDTYIKLKVVKKRDGADQYGKTHYVEVDTFNPNQKSEAQQPTSQAETKDDDPFGDDMPF